MEARNGLAMLPCCHAVPHARSGEQVVPSVRTVASPRENPAKSWLPIMEPLSELVICIGRSK